MIPVRFGEKGPVIGRATKVIADNEGIIVHIELTEEGFDLEEIVASGMSFRFQEDD